MICVNSVSVYPKSISLKVGTWSYAAYAEVCPSDADCKEVLWHSDNPSVASVNASSGYICANGVGTAHIYATATDGSGCSDYLTVTVSNTVPVTSVTLNRSSLSLEEGHSASLSATVCPDNATNKNVNWTSSNNAVATVSNGVVTAVSKGSARITATATDGSGKSASCTVSVTGDTLVESICISPDTRTMITDKAAYFYATVCPESAANRCVTWSSDDPCVATVNAVSGLVYAENAGTTVIRATAQDGSGIVGTCCLTVIDPICVEDITLSRSYLVLYKGNTHRLSATVCPTNATTKTVRWHSSKPSVASVNTYTGTVTAKAAGSTTIYATAQDGSGVRSCCTVSVRQTVVCSVEETPVSKVQGSTFADPVDVYTGAHMLYDPVLLTLKQGEDTYQFDASGRLIKITDASGNHMDITYTSNRITSVTDGAGREFGFTYNTNGQLLSIVAPDLTAINYTYTSYLLTGISYPDGKKAVIAYSSSKPTSVTLQDANGAQVYKVTYSFSGNRLYSVTEYGSDNSIGAKSTYSYSVASARTLVTTTEQKDADEGETANNVITTTYTFDDDGNIVSEYVYSTDTGKVGGDGEESGINPHSGDGGAGIVSNINNLLTGHNFESLTSWSEMPANCGDLYISNYAYETYAKFGKKVLRMQSYNADCGENGVYQVTNTLPKGQYTFSAYLRVLSAFSGTDAGAFIRVTDTAGNVLGVSEHLVKYDSEYTRLIVPFELATAQSVQVQILVNGKGTVYADAAQLENNPYANAYNMLENGNFERGTSGWTCSGGVYSTTGTCFNMSKSLYMSGAVSSDRYAYQTPAVRTTRSTRETFTLSGWAKGYGLPNHDREDVTNAPRFRLRAVIKYYDTSYREYGTEEFTADFSPCTEEWQFASVQFSKSKYRTIQYIRVYCDYGYNSGTVYFDDVQLVRNSLETYLSASDFVVESTGTSDDAAAEATDTTPTFNEAKDKFGNALTETTFTDGDFGTIYRSFKFNADDDCMAGDDAGNNLIEETDARGHKTTYTVDGDTSRNEEVTDRLGNKTAYEYDDSGRTTKVTSKNADGTELAHVSYAYDTFDNMTEIVRGDGMKYALAYNEFHNLESIGIDGKSEALIKYAYKNGNGRLKQMTYANGHTMKAVYNSIGQMVAEKWFETEAAAASSTATPIAHYKYVYDGDGNIVRSIDISGKKEYNYEYEEGRIVRATEADIELNGEIVTSKVIVNTVKYYYDTKGKLSQKSITFSSNSTHTIHYETTDDNTVVKFEVPVSSIKASKRNITSHSKSDSFGRKVFDELQLGTDFISRQFVYHLGRVTEEHKTFAKVKSSATTKLVSQIILSNGTTYSYGYDSEERITSVVETYTVDETPVTNTTLYTYDSLGQLLTETVNGQVVNTMKYDNYGNIVEKNGKAYSYGNEKWNDLLTGFDGKTIEYDAQGNPVKYLGHSLTWEKGRQLKSYDNNTYTYNNNGVRTSKTIDGISHHYVIEDKKIISEIWGNNVLIPLYDNENNVCGIIYNDTPFYFQKDLKDNIVSIIDEKAAVVARYSYDAWGSPTIVQDTSTCEIATINPFRYRGYYYDKETGLYYLLSRYYNPSTCRFLNTDDCDHISIGGHVCSQNLFCYCNNQPTMHTDSEGQFVISTTVLCVIGGALLLGTAGGFVGYGVAKKKKVEKKDTWKYIVGGIGIGAALGAVAGYFVAPVVASATGVSGISITKAGITALPLKTGGQGHHVLSRRIIKAIQNNKNLAGKVNRDKSVVKAWTKKAHSGYQKWHRNIDNFVEKWLIKHPNATLEELGRVLYDQYCTKDMIKRFGEDVLKYIKTVFFK